MQTTYHHSCRVSSPVRGCPAIASPAASVGNAATSSQSNLCIAMTAPFRVGLVSRKTTSPHKDRFVNFQRIMAQSPPGGARAIGRGSVRE